MIDNAKNYLWRNCEKQINTSVQMAVLAFLGI